MIRNNCPGGTFASPDFPSPPPEPLLLPDPSVLLLEPLFVPEPSALLPEPFVLPFEPLLVPEPSALVPDPFGFSDFAVLP